MTIVYIYESTSLLKPVILHDKNGSLSPYIQKKCWYVYPFAIAEACPQDAPNMKASICDAMFGQHRYFNLLNAIRRYE